MEWKFEQDAPRDGTPVLMHDGEFVTAVRFYRWTDEDRDDLPESECDTEGFWQYCDENLAEICPEGPEVPFLWVPHPDMKTSREPMT